MSVRHIALAFVLISSAIAGIVIVTATSDPASLPRYEMLPTILAFVVGIIAALFGSPYFESGIAVAFGALTVTHLTGPPVAVVVCAVVAVGFAAAAVQSVCEQTPAVPAGRAIVSVACLLGGVSLITLHAPDGAPPLLVGAGLVLSWLGALQLPGAVEAVVPLPPRDPASLASHCQRQTPPVNTFLLALPP
jgi:hypothetical protein